MASNLNFDKIQDGGLAELCAPRVLSYLFVDYLLFIFLLLL